MKNIEKVKLYILSLAILFFIVIIMTFKIPKESFPICDFSNSKTLVCFENYFEYLKALIKCNLLPSLMVILLIVCVKIKKDFNYMLSGGAGASIRVCEVKSEDYEHLTFLATYIIPFFGFTFNEPQKLLAYFVLLIVIGFIFVRTDKYYANPTLALFGFKLYKANLSDQNRIYESVIIISKDIIEPNTSIRYKLISDNVFFAKKI
ncbi:anti-phage protein KwaA [Photobacterium toruni]|uniref:Uncharacterized protein n=1 Tax=Photobacterium toruni TaxID=1935446 RepID=A0A1T4V2K5_9GAMM|nr:anti-phage protein KwaA [Photobacterium toruni]SKA58781.1 hypothetical protein CZ814_03998 [Photobacterium toruni]